MHLINTTLNRNYISENDTELCVICRRDTKIPVNTPIQFRDNYIEGMGQICYSCASISNQE